MRDGVDQRTNEERGMTGSGRQTEATVTWPECTKAGQTEMAGGQAGCYA